MGLALSGGGFRAALFHVGVLAALAERGLLRRVAIISTVSGGSVVGALYYLHVKRLLERVPDGQLRDEHYVRIVDQVAHELDACVRRNARLHMLQSARANARMALMRSSPTDRLGEVFDEWLYRPALAGPGPSASRGPVTMRELRIRPAGSAGDRLDPDDLSFDRATPVPSLQINATVLNTGHAWRFTPWTMGEPASTGLHDAVDKADRLDAPDRYERLPDPLRDFPLGKAVAASAAVPGLLPPLTIAGMYADPVRLVDGGVHDNQGLDALFDAKTPCDYWIVSDAAAQLAYVARLPARPFRVLRRCSSILRSRMRAEGLVRTLEHAPFRSLAVHIREGVVPRYHRYRERHPDGRPLPETFEPVDAPVPPDVGIHPVVQERLARMRTDFDAFSQAESHGLMALGCGLTRTAIEARREGERRAEETWERQRELGRRWPESPQMERPRGMVERFGTRETMEPWFFLDVLPHLADPRSPVAEGLRAPPRRLGRPLAAGILVALAVALAAAFRWAPAWAVAIGAAALVAMMPILAALSAKAWQRVSDREVDASSARLPRASRPRGRRAA